MRPYPDWMREVFASNMAYRPKTKPGFAGDMQHDVRDAMLAARVGTLEEWTGWIAAKYIAAAKMLGLRDEPIADSLEVITDFNVWSLAVAHDHLAAYWRYRYLAEFLSSERDWIERDEPWFGMVPAGRSGLRRSVGGCMAAFRWWLKDRVERDATCDPVVIRLVCLVLVQQGTRQGFEAERDLYDALRSRYPLPAKTPS